MIYNNYYTVDSVVKNALTDIGETTTHLYQLFLKFALDGLREQQIEFSREIKTVKLRMNDYQSVDLPEDYVDYIKIGIQVGERIFTMGVQNDIALHNDVDSCGNPIKNLPQAPFDTAPNGINFDNYGGYWFNNFTDTNIGGQGNTGRLFAFGGGIPSRGLYRIDRERRQIRFDDSVHRADIYMEYISDGFNPTDATLVNPLCYEYLRCYIHNRRVEGNDNASQALKYEKGQNLWYAKKAAAGRLGELTVQDIINSSRKGYRLTNKI